MATYSWSTITAQEALGFTDADRLIFDTAGASARSVVIGWGSAVTTLALAGKTLTFLTDEIDGSLNDQFVFLDGTNLLIDGQEADGTMTFEVGGGQALGLSDDAADGSDVIDGSAAEGAIYANGNRGDDSVQGGEGNDTLFGGQGVDQVAGGEGDDSLNGNIGDDVVTGGDGDDSIYGGQDDDDLDGGEGDDWISGDLGDDVALDGGDGNDSVFGGDGDDDLSQTGDGDDSLSGNAGEDVVDGGDGNDVIYGGRDDDELSGGAGDDVISGDLDDDLIDGGEGVDEMTGGEDDDTFFFESGDTEGAGEDMDEDDVDVITDFADDDTLQIDNATGAGSTFSATEADDFDDAVADLSAAAGMADDVVAVLVEEDDGVYVFADIDADGAFGADDVVVFLAGVGEDDLAAGNLAFL
jgi:Ca2+-binding RTX toxin-like protein